MSATLPGSSPRTPADAAGSQQPGSDQTAGQSTSNGSTAGGAGLTAEADLQAVQRLREARQRLKAEMAKVVVGQEEILDLLLIGLLCRGHVLLHGVPGLGKTLMARTMAETLKLDFKRIQFTPDLMPSDITGTDVIEEDHVTGKHRVQFMQGPVFTNFLLADEINRTPPKTQAALLQAMQERQISIGTKTYELSPPFFVVATQNPIEMEGTYPLPEAQLDRFMFNLRVQYPTIDEEVAIIKGTTGTSVASAGAVVAADDLLRLQELIRGVPIADDVIRFAARLVAASRPVGTTTVPGSTSRESSDGKARAATGSARRDVSNRVEQTSQLESIHRYLSYGASPRASQFLVLGAKARAILAGRYHVDFADIQAVARPVLRHRLVLNFHARAEQLDSDALVDRLLQIVRPEGP